MSSSSGNYSATPKAMQIASTLESAILNNEYRQGDFLPSQKELCAKYGASSRSLREAFKVLEAKGLIEVSQGKKAYVKTNKLDQYVETLSMNMFSQDNVDLKMLSDLLDVHITLEVSAARELSRSPARGPVVNAMEECLRRMDRDLVTIETSGDKAAIEDFQVNDFTIHFDVVNSNDNIVFKSIYNTLAPQIRKVMASFPETLEERRKKVREYTYLVDAMREGQTDLVVAMTLVYTTNVKNKFVSTYMSDENTTNHA